MKLVKQNKFYYIIFLSVVLLCNSSAFSQASPPTDNQEKKSSELSLEDRIKKLEILVSELQEKIKSIPDNSNNRAADNVKSSNVTSTTKEETKNLPSETIIKNAITEKIKKEVPPTWAGSLMGGSNGSVQSIEIIQIGNYNERYQYLPVRARVKGICDSELIFKKEKKSFDKVGDFKIKQDDYGKWIAELETL